jgi:alkanesulfonate monooxygenase SsuD/methylene tetrahydromethanopterin reductase-like flavin-dependent oxidoreductase (luciferase family)
VGGVYEEVRRRGLLPDERAKRTDEYIRALRLVWESDERSPSAQASSRHRPAAERGRAVVPVIVGGQTEAAALRAGRLGDGFFPLATSWDAVERLVAVMRRAAGTAERDPRGIPVTCLGSPDFGEEDRRRWQQLGITRVVFPLGGWEPADWDDRLAELAGRVRDVAPRRVGRSRPESRSDASAGGLAGPGPIGGQGRDVTRGGAAT